MEVFEMVMQMERKEGLMQGLVQGEVKGELKERQKQKTIFVENLLRTTDFSDERIASLSDISPAFVAEVRAKLNSN